MLSSSFLKPSRRRFFVLTIGGAILVVLWAGYRQVGGPRFTFSLNDAFPKCIAFSPDGYTVATAGLDDAINLWRFPSGELVGSINTDCRSIVRLKYVNERVIGGQCFLRDPTASYVRYWDTIEKKPIALNGGNPEDVLTRNISPNGKLTAKFHATVINVYDTGSGEELYALSGHAQAVSCIAFSPDSTRLATGTGNLQNSGPHPIPWANSELRIWDTATGKLLARHNWHWAPITDAAFSPDGKFVASCGYDGKVNVWDVP